MWASGVIIQPKDPKDAGLVHAILRSARTWSFLKSLGKIWKSEVYQWRMISSAVLLRAIPLGLIDEMGMAA